MFRKQLAFISALLLSITLTACGSDTTSTTAAAIDTSNKEDVGRAIIQGLEEALASDSAPVNRQLSNTNKVYIDLSSTLCVTGSAGYDVSATSGYYDYDLCTDASGVTYDGTITYTAAYTSNTDFSYSMTYTDFSISSSLYSSTFSGTYSCTLSGTLVDCSFSSLTTYAGVTYDIENITITADLSGYDFSYSMNSSSYGDITVSTSTPISFNCTGSSHPDTGSISFTGVNGSSGTITFDSCTSFTVTVDGVADTYNY